MTLRDPLKSMQKEFKRFITEVAAMQRSMKYKKDLTYIHVQYMNFDPFLVGVVIYLSYPCSHMVKISNLKTVETNRRLICYTTGVVYKFV